MLMFICTVRSPDKKKSDETEKNQDQTDPEGAVGRYISCSVCNFTPGNYDEQLPSNDRRLTVSNLLADS